MAGAGGVELCVAAIEGGALGSLPCALLSPDQVRAQVGEVRGRADGPLQSQLLLPSHAGATSTISAWRALLQSVL